MTTKLEILDKQFENIKDKMGEQGRAACREELTAIEKLLTDSGILTGKSSQLQPQTVIKILEELIVEIDNEAKAITAEVHGCEIFSKYEYDRINQYAYHHELRDWLQNALDAIKEMKS